MNKQQFVNSQWTSMCQSARSHADSMARMLHDARAAKLVMVQLDKFTDQLIPNTDDELSRRQMQQLALSSSIGTISHADSMAKISPTAADEIFRQTTAYCNGTLASTIDEMHQLQMASIALSSTISSLSHGASLARLHGSFKNDPEFDEVLRLGREARTY